MGEEVWWTSKGQEYYFHYGHEHPNFHDADPPMLHFRSTQLQDL